MPRINYGPGSPVVDGGGQVWNVRAWGARGDGVTNDGPVIQLVLNLMPAGGVLYFPPGTYLVNAQLSVPSSVTLAGAGKASIIKAGASLNVLFLVSQVSDVLFTHLTLDGGSALANIGIYLDRCTYCCVDRCTVQNFTAGNVTISTAGVCLNSATDCQVVGNRILSCGYNTGAGGANTGPITTTSSGMTGCIISRNRCTGVGILGVGGHNYHHCQITDNWIDQGNVGNTDNGYGILCYGGVGINPTGNIIDRNHVTNTWGTGIYCNQGIDCAITRNILWNVAQGQDTSSLRVGGIVINNNTRATVAGNKISTVGVSQVNTVCGIGFPEDTDSVIEGNTIYNVVPATGDGINGDGGPITFSGTMVKDNRITSVGRHGIYLGNGAAKFRLTISGNKVTTCGQNAMQVQQLFRSLISGNTFAGWGSGQAGMYFNTGATASSGNTVSDNVFINDGSAQSGQAITLAVSGNKFLRNTINGATSIATGIRDLAGGNVFGAIDFVGTVTTQWDVRVQSSLYLGNYTSGSGAPATTPLMIGEDYLDTTNNVWYRSTNTASSAGWGKL